MTGTGWKRLLVSASSLERLKEIYEALRKSTWHSWLFSPGKMISLVTEAVLIIEHMVAQEAPDVPGPGMTP